MPTYEYRCPKGHEFEHFFRSISSSESRMKCPECGERMTASYDGGAQHDYQLCVPMCRQCGFVDWDALDEDEDDEDDEA